MEKFAAIVNIVAGSVFTLVGTFVVWRVGAFLCDAPSGHLGLVLWAWLILAIGAFLIITGLGRIVRGTNRMYEHVFPDDV